MADQMAPTLRLYNTLTRSKDVFVPLVRRTDAPGISGCSTWRLPGGTTSTAKAGAAASMAAAIRRLVRRRRKISVPIVPGSGRERADWTKILAE